MGHSCPKYRSCVANLTLEKDDDSGYVQHGINSVHFSFTCARLMWIIK